MLTKELIETLKEFQDLQMRTAANVCDDSTFVRFVEITVKNDWFDVRVSEYSRLTEEHIAKPLNITLYNFCDSEIIQKKIRKFKSELKQAFGIVF